MEDFSYFFKKQDKNAETDRSETLRQFSQRDKDKENEIDRLNLEKGEFVGRIQKMEKEKQVLVK